MNFSEEQTKKRGSGRTTRLIQEAVRLALSGKKVCIVAKNCRAIELQIENIIPNKYAIKYFNFIPKNFNWKLMHDNIHSHATWLIEHYLVEDSIQFQNMLKTITAFDNTVKRDVFTSCVEGILFGMQKPTTHQKIKGDSEYQIDVDSITQILQNSDLVKNA